MGPINRPKDGILALTGIVETDWSPYSFTMNWRFTRPGTQVRFEKGEPFCHLLPVRRGELEAFEPDLRSLSDNPGLEREHKAWIASRRNFLDQFKLNRPGFIGGLNLTEDGADAARNPILPGTA
jgi:hypothetical protein